MNANTMQDLASIDPAVLADQYLKSFGTGSVPRLIIRENQFYFHKAGCFAAVDEKTVSSKLTKYLQERYRGVRGRLVSDVLLNLRAKCLRHRTIRDNEWIVPPPGPVGEWQAKDLMFTPDKIINLEARRRGEDIWEIPATPAFFNTSAIAFPFNEHAPEPERFLGFLESVWPGDPESAETLQEWIGYLLTQDNSLEKMLFLVGKPRSGKGVIGTAVASIFGADNCASLSLSDLATDFGSSNFIGKRVGIIGDARLKPGSSEKIIEFLLSTTGNDLQTFNIKNRPHVQGRLNSRIMLMANELPTFNDKSRALEARLVALNFGISHAGREDTSLKKDISEEAPLILNWAIKGFNRLRQRGGFTEPESAATLKKEFTAATSPVFAFGDTQCVFHPGHSISLDDLYAEYNEWMEARDVPQRLKRDAFSKTFIETFDGITSIRRRVNGQKVRTLYGVRLKNTEQPSLKISSGIGNECEEPATEEFSLQASGAWPG